MDTVITVDGFEYVLENGIYVNKNDDAYYDSRLEWSIAENHDGMKGICKKIGERYLVKYVFLKDMDSSLFRNMLSSLIKESGKVYAGILGVTTKSNYIGGLF